jgi:hypothetical protein
MKLAMPKNFSYWKKLHEDQSLQEFSFDQEGLLWLKIKSIIRKNLIEEFIIQNNISLKETTSGKQFVELFDLLNKDLNNSHDLLSKFIKAKAKEQLAEINVQQLVSELYKLKNFAWGDYQNDLNKVLISRYVKVKEYQSFELLISKFETEINPLVQSYVLNSWYNHWSSILIEHIFKSHLKVLPTVGQIKSVDFFINGIPFDLKVTYLPSEYIKERRKAKKFPIELTYLKSKAKEGEIYFDKKASSSDVYYEITEKLKDRNDEFSNKVLNTLKNQKLEILHEAQANPSVLSKWLYENQSAPRFGSENRMFLVLVDTNDFANSWKLKRDLPLLQPAILSYLDNFNYGQLNIKDLEVKFNFPPTSFKDYTSLTDIIFVVKK